LHRHSRIKYLLLLPAVIWVLCFTLFPFLYGVYLSFVQMNFGKPDTFVWFENYKRVFTPGEPGAQSAWITFIFVVVGVLTQMTFGLALAMLLNRKMPFRGTFRALLTMPLFATPIALGLLFRTIFYEEGGPINSLFGVKVPWLSDPHWALASIIIVDIWQWTPFCFLIFLAGLQSIPDDYYEAAMLETRNRWAVFRHITLPMLQPTIMLVLLLRVTEAFKVFDIPYTLTSGGPGTSTQVLSMHAYVSAVLYRDVGYATAISVVMFVVIMIILSLSFKRIRQVYR